MEADDPRSKLGEQSHRRGVERDAARPSRDPGGTDCKFGVRRCQRCEPSLLNCRRSCRRLMTEKVDVVRWKSCTAKGLQFAAELCRRQHRARQRSQCARAAGSNRQSAQLHTGHGRLNDRQRRAQQVCQKHLACLTSMALRIRHPMRRRLSLACRQQSTLVAVMKMAAGTRGPNASSAASRAGLKPLPAGTYRSWPRGVLTLPATSSCSWSSALRFSDSEGVQCIGPLPGGRRSVASTATDQCEA